MTESPRPMSESETESDEEPETFTFPERALKDWKERSKLWKNRGCWIPKDAAASQLSCRWALGADENDHAGGVLPGMIFNHRSQLLMLGVHPATDDMYHHKRDRLVSALLTIDPESLPSPVPEHKSKPKGKHVKQAPAPTQPTGATLEGDRKDWKLTGADEDRITLTVQAATCDGIQEEGLLVRGTAGRVATAHQSQLPIRVTLEVYMPIRESHGSGEAALEPWYIYLGLFKVVNAHTPNKREEKDGSETEVIWEQDYDLEGIPGEHIPWSQVPTIAQSMTLHTHLATAPEPTIWAPSTPQHTLMLTPHTWNHLPALPPIPPKPPKPLPLSAVLPGRENIAENAKKTGGKSSGKSENTAGNGAGTSAGGEKGKGGGGAGGKGSGKGGEEDKENEGVKGGKKKKGDKDEPPPTWKELSADEETDKIFDWRGKLLKREGLVTYDIAEDTNSILPVPVILNTHIPPNVQETLQKQLKFTYISDYQWSPDCLVTVLRQLHRLECEVRDVTGQQLTGEQATLPENITEDVAARWWTEGAERPFCATQVQALLLNERYHCESHHLTLEEVQREMPTVCPFNDRCVMTPGHTYPHVIHQCVAQCDKYGMLCSLNTQACYGATLPLEIYGCPKSKQWTVRCAVPIAPGRFICCVIGELFTTQQLGLSGHQAMQHPSGLLVPLTHVPGANTGEGTAAAPTLIIDMRNKANIARFMRHSENPNLKMQAVYFGGARSAALYYIALIAKTYIPANQELTFDRKSTPWVGLYDPIEDQDS